MQIPTKPKPIERKQFNISLKASDFEKLKEISEHFNCTRISLIESAIRYFEEKMNEEKKSQNHGQ